MTATNGRPDTGQSEQMLTAAQISARYGITPESLRGMRHRREGPPFYRVSERTVLYRISEFEHWLDGKKIQPAK